MYVWQIRYGRFASVTGRLALSPLHDGISRSVSTTSVLLTRLHIGLWSFTAAVKTKWKLEMMNKRLHKIKNRVSIHRVKNKLNLFTFGIVDMEHQSISLPCMTPVSSLLNTWFLLGRLMLAVPLFREQPASREDEKMLRPSVTVYCGCMLPLD